jgi:hypothetical protein
VLYADLATQQTLLEGIFGTARTKLGTHTLSIESWIHDSGSELYWVVVQLCSSIYDYFVEDRQRAENPERWKFF